MGLRVEKVTRTFEKRTLQPSSHVPSQLRRKIYATFIPSKGPITWRISARLKFRTAHRAEILLRLLGESSPGAMFKIGR